MFFCRFERTEDEETCNTHLWNSQKCGNSSPWFLRTLDHPTADNIRVRVCRDQDRQDEDLAISKLELYVQ